jgi:hypothetical protein
MGTPPGIPLLNIKKTLLFPSKPDTLYRDYWNPLGKSGVK